MRWSRLQQLHFSAVGIQVEVIAAHDLPGDLRLHDRVQGDPGRQGVLTGRGGPKRRTSPKRRGSKDERSERHARDQ